MIYISGSNGLIGTGLKQNIQNYIPISYRNQCPEIDFLPNSILIHLSSSTTPRNNFDELESSFNSDVLIPFKMFQNYLKVNPNGRIIFLSTAGDLHSSKFDIWSNEKSEPIPKSIYGTHKLLLEHYTRLLHSQYDFTSIILRTTNVYGGKIDPKRVNGLIDKLICNNKIVITSNIKTTVNFIHISDLINLILQALDVDLEGFNLFLVGGEESISIQDLIKKISIYISPNIVFENENSIPSYINIDTSKVQKYFNWKCKYSIDSGIIKQVKSLNSL
jgi:UDP-glucose 4-epimerase